MKSLKGTIRHLRDLVVTTVDVYILITRANVYTGLRAFSVWFVSGQYNNMSSLRSVHTVIAGNINSILPAIIGSIG